jgi:hypothetical protein
MNDAKMFARPMYLSTATLATTLVLASLGNGFADDKANPAINESSKFAWSVFCDINKPANNGSNDTIWETWATDRETFPSNPVANQPPTWPGNGHRNMVLTPSRQLQIAQLLRERAAQSPGSLLRISPGGTEEVRRNKASFDFIVGHNLWHLDGLIAAFTNGSNIQFPTDSIEIKAEWKPIQEVDKPNYHWNVDGSGTLFGLTALHISTKGLPNWFWATFEQVDNPNRGQALGCHDDFGASPPNNCTGSVSADLEALLSAANLGGEWRHYRLDAAQTDFVDSTGRPTIVGNSVIEGRFIKTSSCITCHARAALDANGAFLEVFKTTVPLEGNVGAPDPSWYWNADGSRKMMQVDFVWGFLAANRLTSSPGSSPMSPSANRSLSDLTLRENRVATLSALQTPQLTNEQIRARAKAAEAFARSASENDDRRYVLLFRDSLNLSVGPTGRSPRFGDGFDARMSSGALVPVPDARFSSTAVLPSPPSSQSIYRDPQYIRNAKKYIQTIQSRIVGGVGGSVANGFTDCVAVGNATGWCCSGNLVAPNVVVTAGHCEGSCGSRVFVGSDVNAGGTIVGVHSAVRNPDYGKNGMHNDLTVLILDQDVAGVTPRPIASTTAIDSAFYVRAVGFGNTDVFSSIGFGIKRVVDIPVATAACTASDSRTRYGCDNGLELVAGAPFLDKDTCNGDSGGPIYVETNGNWYLAGVTSRATAEATRPCGDGGIYVRVDKYVNWIKSVPGGHW